MLRHSSSSTLIKVVIISCNGTLLDFWTSLNGHHLVVGDKSGAVLFTTGFLQNLFHCDDKLLAKQQTYLSLINELFQSVLHSLQITVRLPMGWQQKEFYASDSHHISIT